MKKTNMIPADTFWANADKNPMKSNDNIPVTIPVFLKANGKLNRTTPTVGKIKNLEIRKFKIKNGNKKITET